MTEKQKPEANMLQELLNLYQIALKIYILYNAMRDFY